MNSPGAGTGGHIVFFLGDGPCSLSLATGKTETLPGAKCTSRCLADAFEVNSLKVPQWQEMEEPGKSCCSEPVNGHSASKAQPQHSSRGCAIAGESTEVALGLRV